MALMLLLLVLGPILLIRAYLSYFDYEDEPKPKGKGVAEILFSRKNAMMAANILILMGLLVTIFIMLLRLGGELSPEEFEAKLAPLAIICVSVMMVYHYGIRKARLLPYAALAIGLAAGFVALVLYPEQPIASFSIPFLGVVAISIIYHIVRAPRARRKAVRLHDAGAPLIHLGIVLMLLGYAGSTFLVQENTVTLSENTPVKLDDYELVLVEFDEGTDHWYITIEVWKDGQLQGQARPGMKVIQGLLRSEVSVVRMLDVDLHFVLENWIETGEGTRAQVVVKSLPGISLLWGGVGMLATGTILRFSPTRSIEQKSSTIGPRIVPQEEE
jgi:cytochrome c biogenesis factor